MIIGVIKGGPSSEHEVSLHSAENVERALSRKGFSIKPIFIDRSGVWYVNGGVVNPVGAINQVDVVFNALHGEYGEDGGVQRVLEAHQVPFTGSGSMACALAMNKVISKKILLDQGVSVADHRIITNRSDAYNVENFERPVVIKPVDRGSSVGTNIVRDSKKIKNAIHEAFKFSKRIIVEDFIDGTEVTCGVLENFSGQDIKALPPTEIIPRSNNFFDYNSKYQNGGSYEITPARLNGMTMRRIQEIAKMAHQILGCRHYSRTDMIVKDGKVYFLEINTLPGLTSTSLLPQGARAADLEFDDLIEHLVLLALGKR